MRHITTISFLVCLTIYFTPVYCRNHKLELENDIRRYFSVTTFGFFNEGRLEVTINKLMFTKLPATDQIMGLTLTRTVSDSITPYMESHQNKCLLSDDSLAGDGNVEIVSFLLDLKNNVLVVNCSKLFYSLEIKPGKIANSPSAELTQAKETSSKAVAPVKPKAKRAVADNTENVASDSVKKSNSDKEEYVSPHNADKPEPVGTESKPLHDAEGSKLKEKEGTLHNTKPTESSAVGVDKSIHKGQKCEPLRIPFQTQKDSSNGEKAKKIYIHDLQFTVLMKSHESEGLYSLYFHNCIGKSSFSTPVNLTISIVEQNGENFLSAGEIFLPKLYFVMSFVFFVTGCIWIQVLKRKKEETFKIHYLMGLLVFVKSLSLLFHGMFPGIRAGMIKSKIKSRFWINFHIIAKDGYPMEAWAVLYYITHLLKGALLFITIVLIGTGWAFIKHILSDKDKKIFMIVIPLQVLANVAKIIMEESEEGESQHYTWREVFILVDLLCCGAILFPVVWSIRHLQEASQTDGKAAINLEKLKLFRHFYVMIVCYIYFTRIIVYLLKITVPFQYEWLDELFRETATLSFFILTGYNFRPTTSNPYFRLSQEEEIEISEVITQTGFTEGVTKTVRSRDFSDHGAETTPTKRESSHEYD